MTKLQAFANGGRSKGCVIVVESTLICLTALFVKNVLTNIMLRTSRAEKKVRKDITIARLTIFALSVASLLRLLISTTRNLVRLATSAEPSAALRMPRNVIGVILRSLSVMVVARFVAELLAFVFITLMGVANRTMGSCSLPASETMILPI